MIFFSGNCIKVWFIFSSLALKYFGGFWFDLVLWYIKHCWLYNTNPVYSCILDIYDL